MKKFGILMTLVALMTVTSCSTLSGGTDTAAAASGATCGRALVALNKSHKAGTLSVANTNDLSNMLVVINAYNALKTNKNNNSFKKSFATGMVTGGSGVITTANATSIMNSMLNNAGLGNINSSNIATNVQTISTIVQLLGALN